MEDVFYCFLKAHASIRSRAGVLTGLHLKFLSLDSILFVCVQRDGRLRDCRSDEDLNCLFKLEASWLLVQGTELHYKRPLWMI